MGKFFPASTRHAKAREFLELRQGAMSVLEYVAKFTKLARFEDDYVAIDMAKVRKFEDGLKLSIQGKIVGLLLQDMDSMVRTAMAIKREVNDAKSIKYAGSSDKRKEKYFSRSRNKQMTSSLRGFQRQGRDSQGQGQDQSSQYGRHFRAPSQPEQRVCF